MTPQSNFMVVAPIVAGREDDLRQLLASMNRSAGVVDPQNPIVPFGGFDRLHFARIVILDDATLDDITVYGQPRVNYPTYLVFLGDCDGPAEEFLFEVVDRAGSGLRRIFSHCQDFTPDADLLNWMRAHNQKPATIYVNWIGRTVRQVREEDVLRQSLEGFIQTNAPPLAAMRPRQIHQTLRNFVRSEQQAGRLQLTPAEPTPLGWQLRNLFHLVGVPLILLIIAPFLLVYLLFFIFQLRRRERSDPEIAPCIDPDHARRVSVLEDHDVTNQFSAFGSIKPGRFRRWTLSFFLWVIGYTTKHIFNRGRLARVNTIHFARWVWLDDKRRLFFASNYDGSLDSLHGRLHTFATT
jgi:hypothetical protein